MNAPRGAARTDGIRLVLAGTALLLAAACWYTYVHRGVYLGVPIRSDGMGYYAYLPSVFLYHDVSMRTLAEQVFGGTMPGYSGVMLYGDSGAYLDKFPIGVAILQAPFFLAAHAFACVFLPAGSANGFSAPYQIGVLVAGGTYFLLGLRLQYGLLRRFVDRNSALATLLVLTFTTNVFDYASFDSNFSHIYSYFLVSALLALLARLAAPATASDGALWVLVGTLLSLVVCARPTNAVVGLLVIPFWLRRQRLDGNMGRALVMPAMGTAARMVVGGLPLIALQLAYWHTIWGHWFVYSYGGEPFYWASPALGKFLFSERRGLLFWDPAVILAFAGLFLLWVRWKALAATIATVIALQVYVCSSWWCWWFGGAYGSRTFVEMMPVLAIAASLCASAILQHMRLRLAVVAAAAVLVLVNGFFLFSYWKGDIPWDGPNRNDLRALAATYRPSRWSAPVPYPRPDVAASLHLDQVLMQQQDRTVTMQFVIANDSDRPLIADLRSRVHLAWRFVPVDRRDVGAHVGWNNRSALAEDLPPHGAISVRIDADTPWLPGEYWVEVSMVAENNFWFHDRGMHVLRFDGPVRVAGPSE